MSKIVGKGSRLQVDIATTFVDVAQIISITAPEPEVEMFDATTLDSADGWKEHESTGYTEPGEVQFELFLDPALQGHDDLRGLLASREVVDWNLIYSDGTEDEFSATLTKIGANIVMGDGVKTTVTAKLTGAITFDAP